VEGDLRCIPLSWRSHVIGFQTLWTGITEHESALQRDFVTLTRFPDAGATVTSQPTMAPSVLSDKQKTGASIRTENEYPISARQYPKLGTPTKMGGVTSARVAKWWLNDESRG